MTEYIPTQDELTQQMMMLLPNGLAWQKDTSSNLYAAMYALMGVFTDFYASAANLLVDAFPASSVYLLPNWEDALGLPDPCQGEAPTIQQRQQQVVARFVGLSGESVADIIAFAANLGYTITITESSPNFADNDYATTPLYYTANYIFINLANYPINYFRVGNTPVGNALQSIEGVTVLECELPRIVPATSTLVYNII